MLLKESGCIKKSFFIPAPKTPIFATEDGCHSIRGSDLNATLFGNPAAPVGPVVLRPRITPGLLYRRENTMLAPSRLNPYRYGRHRLLDKSYQQLMYHHDMPIIDIQKSIHISD